MKVDWKIEINETSASARRISATRGWSAPGWLSHFCRRMYASIYLTWGQENDVSTRPPTLTSAFCDLDLWLRGRPLHALARGEICANLHWNCFIRFQNKLVTVEGSSADCWPGINETLFQFMDDPHWFLINTSLRYRFNQSIIVYYRLTHCNQTINIGLVIGLLVHR